MSSASRRRLVPQIAACAALLAIFAGGCADTPPEKEGGMGGPGGPGGGPGGEGGPGRGGLPPGPPPFLAGPIGAAFLNNAEGFMAHMAMEIHLPEGRTDVIEGELTGRGSKLLFTPQPTGHRGKEMRAARISFLWDVADRQGYVISEALQGCAPIAASTKYTIASSSPLNDRSPTDKVDGHTCEVQNVTLASSDGATSSLRVWRAAEFKGLPLQIASGPDVQHPAFRLSKIRPASPGPEVFTAPEGFTKYRTMQAMMSELMLRQASVKHKTPPEGGPEGEHGPPGGDRSNPTRSY